MVETTWQDDILGKRRNTKSGVERAYVELKECMAKKENIVSTSDPVDGH